MKSKNLCKKCEKETIYEDFLCMDCWKTEYIKNKLLELKKESKKIPKSEIAITIKDIHLSEKDIYFHIVQSIKQELTMDYLDKFFKKIDNILNK